VNRSGEAVLADLQSRWSDRPPPIIVFCKSHSGSRVLARLLLAAGVYLGPDRNESEDAVGLLDLVRPMVERHYPSYGTLMRHGDPDLERLVTTVLDRHLAELARGQRWGWKLCESLYILPILHRLFPTAQFVHLVRDGRDVAFSDHIAPTEAFWRKVYFDTAVVERWRHLRLSARKYKECPHRFNARHWVNSVTTARHYGAMIGANYREVRYEALVAQPLEECGRVLSELGLGIEPTALRSFAATIEDGRVGKFRRQPLRKRAEAESVLRPTLESFGYGIDEAMPRRVVLWWRP
jgi:hypothetical protein